MINQSSLLWEPVNILIVDDTPMNLRLLSKMLSDQGYEVRQAINGKMAMTALKKSLPDIILLDVMMPDLSGYQICAKLKSDPATAEIPIIFLSALSHVTDKVKAFSMGASDYITKPFQVEEILVRIQNQLHLKNAKEQLSRLNLKLEERVSQRKAQLEMANTKLRKMSIHDPLTGLPNRRFIMQRLERSLNRSQSHKDYQFAVLFMDCDRFKIINDSLGHLVGDELLIKLSRRLKSLLSPQDLLARLGGDEFAILLDGIKHRDQATQMADQILAALSEPFQVEKHEIFINSSIGIVLWNPEYNEPENLLRDADTAVYRAKALGRGRYHIFDTAMHWAVLNILELETELYRAIRQEEFVVYYQPILHLKTGKIMGFEALVRWEHPRQGLIFPGSFIPIAEEIGLMTSLGSWVLKQACHQLKTWQTISSVNSLFMSVNLSARQLSQFELIDEIDKIIAETKIDPACLKLEITESAIMNNPTTVPEILQQLKQRHIQLGIDDFGTGYSSLSSLHSFPLDTIKIDQSFVRKIDETSENLGLVPVIISIAETLGMNVIAEGIETSLQLEQLKSLNCPMGQGYLFSQAVEADVAMELLTSPSWFQML